MNTSASTSKLTGLERTRVNGSTASLNGLTNSASSASLNSIVATAECSTSKNTEATPAKRVGVITHFLLHWHNSDVRHAVFKQCCCSQLKLREKVVYDDLAPSQSTSNATPLTIANADRYLQGPTPIVATAYNTSEDVLDVSPK